MQMYPKIQSYAFIADCHSAALVSSSGSIDWCCMPRIDSHSCFCRILDWERGGYYRIYPSQPYEASRRYIGNTLALETTFKTESGQVRLVDVFSMRSGGKHEPYQEIIRRVEGLDGTVEMVVELMPRFDFGTLRPWIRPTISKNFIAIGGNDGLFISGDFPLDMRGRHDLEGTCTIEKGQRRRLSMVWRRPEELDEGRYDMPDEDEMDRRIQATLQWWETWASQYAMDGDMKDILVRSAIVLKGLSNSPTGAIAAAATTSLPEAPGQGRNWDYRYSWIRDSCFTVRALSRIGYNNEANGFRRFIERAAAGSAEDLQILYGVGGERRMYERDLPRLNGYRNARPVRIGNSAKDQLQLDAFGEILDLAWQGNNKGHAPDDDYWDFLVDLVNMAARRWTESDHGFWELRDETRHFVQSKVMCWAALDRGIRMAQTLGRKAPIDAWQQAREEVRRAVEEKGYDKKRGIFIQAFDHPAMDAALLLLPTYGFLDYRDPRMLRTTDAVRAELDEGGLLRRYQPGDDGMGGREGVFVACTFWLVECLAFQGRLKEARDAFNRAMAAGNDIGLFSEEYDPAGHDMLGNFPQGLSHLSLINAACALASQGRKRQQ